MPRYYGAFQSTILGRAVRIASGNRLFKYKDEVHVPVQYTKTQVEKTQQRQRDRQEQALSAQTVRTDDATLREDEGVTEQAALAGAATELKPSVAGERASAPASGLADPAKEKDARLETLSTMEGGPDPNLVTWYGPNDPENP